MPFAIAAGVATVAAASMAADASNSAANSAERTAEGAINEQRMTRAEYARNIAPYTEAGTSALAQLNALNSGDFSSYEESPDYQFRFDEGMRGVDRSAAARGAVNAGGTDTDRIAFGQGMASQGYGDYYNRLYELARMGQNAIAGQGTLAQGNTNNVTGLMMANADAQGQAAIQQANAYGGALMGLANLGGQYGRKSAYEQPYTQQFGGGGGFGQGGGMGGGGLSSGYGSTGGYNDIFGTAGGPYG